MNIIAIIPARMNSSRFPGKPLKKILGTPMIGHCYFRTSMNPLIKETYIATCDKEIASYIKSIGGKYIMTSKKHERASDRTAEAMLKIEKIEKKKVDIVVMVQGDEPMLKPNMISEALSPFKKKNVNVVNLMSQINNLREFIDPNEVKVVVNKKKEALYFSREPIPSRKKGKKKFQKLKQVCIIPFRRNYLLKFNKMEETVLEKIESVDMMRVLENQEKVHMVMTENISYSVDTKEDLKKVERLMKKDKIRKLYISK